MYVRPKKSLGQHFLHDRNIAAKIVNSLRAEGYRTVIEVGPGLGVLTGYLLERKDLEIIPVEIDREAVEFLKETYPVLCGRIVEGDFPENGSFRFNGRAFRGDRQFSLSHFQPHFFQNS